MTRLFIYTTPFRNAWKAMGVNDTDLVQLEEILLENPQKGDVIDMSRPVGSNVTLFVGRQPWFTGEMGVYKKNMAVRIKIL